MRRQRCNRAAKGKAILTTLLCSNEKPQVLSFAVHRAAEKKTGTENDCSELLEKRHCKRRCRAPDQEELYIQPPSLLH